MDDLDVGAGRREDPRSDREPRPVGGIEDEPDPRGIDGGGQRQAMLLVVPDAAAAIDRPAERFVADATELLRAPDQPLELVFDGVVELQPVGI